jgi:PST family polysaccharide transporter
MSAAGLVVSQGLNFVFYLVLARLATPEDFGIVAGAAVIVGAALLFAESGLVSAVIQREEGVEEAANTALVATVLSGLALGVVSLALSPLVGAFFDSRETGLAAAAMSGFLVIRAATLIPDGLMRRRFSFVRRLVVEPGAVIAFGAVAITLCAQGYGFWGLVIGQYASVLVQFVLTWSLARWRPNLRLASFSMWRELAGFGRHLILADAVQQIATAIPTALIGRYVSIGALGQYRYASRFASQPFAVLLNSASFVLFPALSRITRDPPRFRAAFVRSLRWIAVMALPSGFVFLPLGEPLLVLLLGEEWRPAGIALMAMFAYTSARCFDSLATEAIIAWGEPRVVARMHLIGLGLTAVLMISFLPFGLVGVAAGLSLSAVGVAVYAMMAVCRRIELPLSRAFAEIWPPALAATVMTAAMLALEHLLLDADGRSATVGVVFLALEILVGAVVYLGALGLLRPARLRDLFEGATRVMGGLRRRVGRSAAVE